LVSLALAAAAWSQSVRPDGPLDLAPVAAGLEPAETVQPPRVGIRGQLSITLPQVIERVLSNNPDLQVAHIARQEADYTVTAAEGYYDPVVGLQADHYRSVTPTASLIGGSSTGKLTQSEWAASPIFNGFFPWLGGSYSMTFANSRQQSDSTFATINPQYPASVSLVLTQPLWRGLRFDNARYNLQVARKNTGLSSEQLRQSVIQVVTQAVQQYWELDYALQNLNVQAQAVRLAEQQRESNRRQAEQGVLAPIDVVAAQTQVATFETSLFAARQALALAENNLKTLMLSSRSDALWEQALIPETPTNPDRMMPDLENALKRAFGSRPELSANLITGQIVDLQVGLNREAVKPRVDATATLTSTGLAGHPQAVAGFPSIPGFSFGSSQIPPQLIGSYGQSIANIGSGNFTTARFGLQVSLPLRNRTAESNLATSLAEKHRNQVQRTQLEMAIEADVRTALESVNSARARYNASMLASRSAQEQYESEQRQFQAGTSTVFLVLQRQTDMISARSREVRARADLAESVATFDRATAATIDTYQITLAP
jgi:HAE1 family hydrophobic/amphiphilic exporter-1